jgi:Tfp pilus assembly protein PilF
MPSLFENIRFAVSQYSVTLARFTVTGEDATAFLHGQTTADINKVKIGEIAIQAITDRTGKLEAYFWAGKSSKHWELFVPPAYIEAVQNRFEKFVVSEDVTLSPPEFKTCWLAIGPSCPTDCKYRGTMGGESTAWSESIFEGIPVEDERTLHAFLAWQGGPSLAGEATHELINQTRAFIAVDMGKGCFPGQETVAKIHHNRGAAWAPGLLHSHQGAKVPNQISLEGKAVVKIESASHDDWAHASILRDVRVEGLKLVHENHSFTVHLYPRFPSDPKGKAKETFHLGTDAFQEGNEELALKYWDKSIALDPTYSDAHEAIGVLLGRQNRFDEAIARMERLLEIDPNSVMAHTNLSLFLMKQGKIAEAENHKSLATVASFAGFGRAAQEKKATEARLAAEEEQRKSREGMYRQVLEIDPEDALANYGLASIFHERGDFSEALPLLEQVLRSDPRYSVAYLLLGKVLKALGRDSQAREILSQGVKVAALKGDMMPANEMQSLLVTNG